MAPRLLVRAFDSVLGRGAATAGARSNLRLGGTRSFASQMGGDQRRFQSEGYTLLVGRGRPLAIIFFAGRGTLRLTKRKADLVPPSKSNWQPARPSAADRWPPVRRRRGVKEPRASATCSASRSTVALPGSEPATLRDSLMPPPSLEGRLRALGHRPSVASTSKRLLVADRLASGLQ